MFDRFQSAVTAAMSFPVLVSGIVLLLFAIQGTYNAFTNRKVPHKIRAFPQRESDYAARPLTLGRWRKGVSCLRNWIQADYLSVSTL